MRKDGHLLMDRTILYSTSMKHMPPFSSQCYICEVDNHKCHGFQLQWQLHWLCKYQKCVDTKLRDIEAALETRLVIPFVDINYCMVGNFREGFIFVFFASQEPFAKIKTTKISLSTCEVNEPHFNTAANRSMSASVPLTAIAEAIQKIEMLAT